jgi:hypothetical protein
LSGVGAGGGRGGFFTSAEVQFFSGGNVVGTLLPCGKNLSQQQRLPVAHTLLAFGVDASAGG